MKIAIVHDWLNQMGGAEKVLEVLVEMFPEAPIFTTIYWKEHMPAAYRRWDIRPTWLDKAPGIHRHHQPYLLFYPRAVESMDLRGYDLVLSNKSGFCHGVRLQKGQKHICYCLTPTRYVWDYRHYAARENFGPALDALLKPFIGGLRRWDYEAAQRVDDFIAISGEVQGRIKRYYRRDSAVIYPPVDVEHYRVAPDEPGDYYLIVSRLIPYKRIDLAIRVCSELRRRLIVVGDGRQRAALQAMAGETIEFRGRLPEAEVKELLAHCRAFIFPGYEDFGIAPVEAMASGRPVVAYAAGGALDTIREGESGLFFREQSVPALAEALQRLEKTPFDSRHIRAQAERFSTQRFKEELSQFINCYY